MSDASSKFTKGQYQDYWIQTHRRFPDDLEAVCFPGKPRFFNQFFDRVQKFAISQYLQRERVNLRGADLLDIGCGRGRWLKFFQDKYQANPIGLDLSAASVSSCVQKGLPAVCGSVTDIPLVDRSFDVVTSVTVLLHLPFESKQAAISELHRVLRPGGTAILIESTWNDPSPHVYGMQLANWEAVFRQAGFVLSFKWGHCYNLLRRIIPAVVPTADLVSIFPEYLVEYGLMWATYARASRLGMQHVMVFKK